jgi:LysR family hydrogen peroxide-inducible transcriptional activator
MVKEGKLDAAILTQSVDHKELEKKELFEEPLFLAVSKEHPLALLETVHQSDLKDEDVLLPEDGEYLKDYMAEVYSNAEGREKNDFRASSLETLKQMVIIGNGITLMPQLAVQNDRSENGEITYIPFTDPVPTRKISMLWRKSSLKKPCLEKIGNLIKQGATKELNKEHKLTSLI